MIETNAAQVPKIIPKKIDPGDASDLVTRINLGPAQRKRIMPYVLSVLVIILGVLIGVIVYQRNQKVEGVIPTTTPIPSESPRVSPTQTPPPSSGIKLEFTVRASALNRSDGKDTVISFYVPKGTTLTKNTVNQGQALQNTALNYSIIGSTFRLDIFSPNETFPLQLDSYFAIGSVSEIGEIFRNGYLSEGKMVHRYFSKIKTEGSCSNGGSNIEAPCGEPGVYFSDKTLPNSDPGHDDSEIALEGRLVFSCTSAQAKSCDDIILSMVIDPAPE